MKKSNTIMVFLVGVSLTVAALSLSGQLNLNDTAKAAVANKEADKSYTPTFEEWVTIWLKIHIEDQDGFAGKILAHRGGTYHKPARWVLTLYLTQDSPPPKKKTQMNYWKFKKDTLQKQIDNWKSRGYDISIKDFVFNERLKTKRGTVELKKD
jgi:hypothetical protein